MSKMSLKETHTTQDIEAALGIMSGDMPRHSSEVLPELKLTLSEHIRRELASLLKSPNFKREMAQELKLIEDKPGKLDPKAAYVKLHDLKGIVSKLITRNVVGRSLTTMQENSKKFGIAIRNMEQQMLKLTKRVDQLEMDMQELTICENSEPTDRDIEPVKSSPRQRAARNNTRLSSHSTEESTDLNNSQHYRPRTDSERLRIYNDLINKYQLKHGDTSSECSSAERHTTYVPSSTKSTADEMGVLSSPDEAVAECAHLHEDIARRAAERRQYETNMLVYRKSQFSIKLNNQINKMLFNKGPASEKHK